jgi:hypothetical protein
MWVSHAVSAALAFGPAQTPTPTTEFDVSDMEVELGEDLMRVATFDAGGDQSAEVTITADGRQLDVTFADGLYLIARVNERGEIVELESPDTAEVSRRMALIRDFDLAAIVDPGSTKGEAQCYGGLIGAAGGIIFGNPFVTMAAGFIIACHCLPLVNDTPTPGCG